MRSPGDDCDQNQLDYRRCDRDGAQRHRHPDAVPPRGDRRLTPTRRHLKPQRERKRRAAVSLRVRGRCSLPQGKELRGGTFGPAG
jgi:hypothetical protein